MCNSVVMVTEDHGIVLNRGVDEILVPKVLLLAEFDELLKIHQLESPDITVCEAPFTPNNCSL